MQITYFPSLKSAQGELKEIDLDQFLSQPKVCTDKRGLPLFTFAKFKENYRDGSHYESCSILGFDVDVDPIPDEAAIKGSLSRLGISGFYHTSSSARAGQLRWRLFVELSRTISGDEYRSLHTNLRSALGFPVGQQAVDPTRAWFVPAKSIAGVYKHGSVEIAPLPVDEWLSKTQSNRTRTQVLVENVLELQVNLPPNQEIHAQLIQYLASVWPSVGRRDECHMALAGTLARLGYGPDWVGQVIHDLSAATGSDKGEARASMVRRTFTKMQSGGAVSSWSKLCEILGDVNAQQIHDILNIRLPSFSFEKKSTEPLPRRNPSHSYSYEPGQAAAAELKQATMSDLVGYLTDHPDWKHVLRWNVVSDTIVAVNPPLKLEAEDERFSNADVTNIRMWLEAHGVKAGRESAAEAIEAAAKKILWNPIEEYLLGLKDAPGAIERLCTEALHVTDALSISMVRKQLIAAVRRALTKSGVKVDTVLVFKGPQGKNKTQFIETLFGEKYVTKHISDIKNKDSVQELRGIWAVEFGELASIANAEVEALKEFLSRAVDKYRPSYGRTKIDVPRTNVFFGTTNADGFLKDETGNRRFWVVEIGSDIDLDFVREHRDEIWGEALHAAKRKEPHWFSKEDEEKAETRSKEFLSIDAWAESVYSYCVGKELVRTDLLYQMAICGGDTNAAKSLDEKVQRRLGRILTIFGAKPGPHRMDGRVIRAWKLPEVFRSDVRVEDSKVEVPKLLERFLAKRNETQVRAKEHAEPSTVERTPPIFNR